LRIALTVGVLFGFPALALWARRNGGRVRLIVVTGAAFAVVTAFSVFAASMQFGNRIAASAGAKHTAAGTVLLYVCSLGLPLAAAAFAASALSHDRLPFWAVYAATIGAASFGWMLGVVGASWLLPMFL
jgi:hypothetical protein